MNFSVNGQNADAASCRVKRKRQRCLFYIALCLRLVMYPAVYAEEETEPNTTPVTVKTESDCDRATVLDLRVVYEDETLSGLVAPPAGVYPFEPGDGVVLRAYGIGEVPVTIEWSGDIKGNGETQFVDMDDHKRITVTFRRTAQWPEKKTPPWFDVAENKNYYAFLGGGDLYGWFTACRHEKKGAGITHLTHRKAFLTPVFNITSLNFEHIFSGVEADNYRSAFTPRTDPMRFLVESPGAVRVHWPKEGASWNIESEMVYCFTDEDAIDVQFSATLHEDVFPLGYIGFMWANYLSRFLNPCIYFKGVSLGVEDWKHFGPVDDSGQSGGTVANLNADVLVTEPGYTTSNLSVSEDMFFSEPVYYGLLDLSLPESDHENPMALTMMFDQSESIRFSVWNWCAPTAISAWDWQYIWSTSLPDQRVDYKARMICRDFRSADRVLSLYREWCKSPAPVHNNACAYPEIPLYWSPSLDTFEPLKMACYFENYNPDKALELYWELLQTKHYGPCAAQHVVTLFETLNNTPSIKAWINSHRKVANTAQRLCHLGHAYFNKDDFDTASFIFENILKANPHNTEARLYLGSSYLWLNRHDEGLQLLENVATDAPQIREDVAAMIASCAFNALKNEEYALAEKLYRRATTFDPDNIWYAIYLGESLEKQGKKEEALPLFRRGMNAEPESAYIANLLHDLFTEKKDMLSCVELWRELYDHHPDAILPKIYLARALYESGAYERAVAIARQFANDDNPDLLLYLCAAQLFLDNLEEARSCLLDLAQINFEYASSVKNIFSSRAQKAEGLGEYVLAAQMFRDAITVMPGDFMNVVRLAEILEKTGKYKEALDFYVQVIVNVKDAPQTASKVDSLLSQHFTPKQRKDTWLEIKQHIPESALPFLYLGKVCETMGNHDAALDAYQRALEIDPSLDDAQNGVFRLEAATVAEGE